MRNMINKKINVTTVTGIFEYTIPKAQVYHSKRSPCEYSVGSIQPSQASIHLQVGGYDSGPKITFDKGDKQAIKALKYLIKLLESK